MRVLLKSKRSQLALDIRRRGGYLCANLLLRTWGACTQLPRDIVSHGLHTYFRWQVNMPNMQFRYHK